MEQLPAVVDCVAAMQQGSPRVFDHWADNAYITSTVVEGNPQVLASAPVRVRRKFRMNRQATVPLECRGVLAYWDHRMNELVVYLSTQGGQVKRIGLSRMLGLPENQVRVIAPDVGGGFGGKNRLMPEDVAVAAIAMKVGHPVRWIEDRREHLLASVHARDHYYDLTLSADRDGTLARHRGRHLYRCRRLCAVADRRVPGSEHGLAQSDRPLSHPPSESQDLHGRHQQGADGAVSRGRAAGRVLCDRAAGRRDGARAWPRAVRSAPPEHRHRRRAALRHGGGHAARHRRLCRRARYRARHDRSRRRCASARPPASRMAAPSASALRSTPSRAATARRSSPSANSA